VTQLAVQAEGLGKRYRLGGGGYATLREQLAGRLRRGANAGNGSREVWALRDLDLQIGEGDVVGIVGRNGAGKTTFLKTVARIVRPTTGVVRVRGRVGALLEVGTGFHPELTGRENVFLNGVVLGMSRREIRRRFDDIVEFAGVERFLDTPLKRYSSGMYLRLAFAVAAHIDPDVLIVDEVLAVGDAEFQRRCLSRMSEFGHEGRTVLFVSHDTGAVGQLCRRAIWLEQGSLRADGAAHNVLDSYLRTTVPSARRVAVPVRPDSAIEDLSFTLLDKQGEQVDAPKRDQPLTFEVSFTARQPVRALDASVFLIDRQGVRIVNENLSDVGETISGPAQAYRIRVTVPPLLAAGDYVVGIWLGNNDELVFRGEVLRMTVLPLPGDRQESVHGAVRPEVNWSVETTRLAQESGS
jgi:ABC-type polysaccharide/polyol phosphate transport system ATPase subunit